MKNIPGRSTLILLLVFLFLCLKAQEQINVLDQTRVLASKQRFEDAMTLVEAQLLNTPEDFDLQLMHIRLLGWMGKFGPAIHDIRLMRSNWPMNKEVTQLETDLYYWSEDGASLLTACTDALKLFPGSYEFQYKKALALYWLSREEEALQAIKQLCEEYPNDEKALSLLQELEEKILVNEIQLSYRFTGFDKGIKNWHNTSLMYLRKIESGSLGARINHGYQFLRNDVQFEVDYYPKLSKKSYAYLNAGVSGGEFFSRFSAAVEFYYALSAASEFSTGVRLTKYDLGDVLLLSGSIGKYFGNYWIATRPIFVVVEHDRSFSWSLRSRRYFEDRDHFLGISLVGGKVPMQFATFQEISRVNSKQIIMEYQRELMRRTLISVAIEHQIEEYNEFGLRKRYAGEFILKRRF